MAAKTSLSRRGSLELHYSVDLAALRYLRAGHLVSLCLSPLQSVGLESASERKRTFGIGSLRQSMSSVAPQIRSSRNRGCDAPFAGPRVWKRSSSIDVPAWLEPWRCNLGQFVISESERAWGGGKGQSRQKRGYKHNGLADTYHICSNKVLQSPVDASSSDLGLPSHDRATIPGHSGRSLVGGPKEIWSVQNQFDGSVHDLA